MAEIWKDVVGYQGLYEVSDYGNVRNVLKNGKLLKLTLHSCGYLSVNLCKRHVRKDYRVHRIVAEAFIPNPRHLPEINHKDENKANNHADNLEWCDRLYNVRYGTRTERSAEKHAVPVEQLTMDGIVVKTWDSMAEAGRHGYNFKMISACCNGRKKTHRGYIWRYCVSS